jgi:hypothetical protein
MNQTGWNMPISQFIHVKSFLKMIAGWNWFCFLKHRFHILHFPNSTGLSQNQPATITLNTGSPRTLAGRQHLNLFYVKTCCTEKTSWCALPTCVAHNWLSPNFEFMINVLASRNRDSPKSFLQRPNPSFLDAVHECLFCARLRSIILFIHVGRFHDPILSIIFRGFLDKVGIFI